MDDPMIAVRKTAYDQVGHDIPHQIDIVGRKVYVLVPPDHERRGLDDGLSYIPRLTVVAIGRTALVGTVVVQTGCQTFGRSPNRQILSA